MIKNYVTFVSPGTFFTEQTTREIDSWNISKASEMSKEIVERYGARPFAFYFTRRERREADFDSKEVSKSGMFYLGGTIKTLGDLLFEDNPKNDILISNMQSNNWKRVIVTNNSYPCTQPLYDNDVVLDL